MRQAKETIFIFFVKVYKRLNIANKLNVKKACHCNEIFLRKTKLILALNCFVKKCSYYYTSFAFRRSGIHPPFVIKTKL